MQARQLKYCISLLFIFKMQKFLHIAKKARMERASRQASFSGVIPSLGSQRRFRLFLIGIDIKDPMQASQFENCTYLSRQSK